MSHDDLLIIVNTTAVESSGSVYVSTDNQDIGLIRNNIYTVHLIGHILLLDLFHMASIWPIIELLCSLNGV